MIGNTGLLITIHPSHLSDRIEGLVDLVPIRSVFLESIEKIIPGIANQLPDALQTFKGFLARREITPLLGKLAFDVLKTFDASPMLLVNEPRAET
jgi:hypothetical protein